MGTALVGKRRSLYQLRSLEQAITLEVRNAVHQLEQSKLSMTAARLSRDLISYPLLGFWRMEPRPRAALRLRGWETPVNDHNTTWRVIAYEGERGR